MMNKRTLGVALALIVSATMASAVERDKREDKLTVRSGHLWMGDEREAMNAIMVEDLCVPELSDGDMLKAFIKISNVGATALGFDLDGFSDDGTRIDPAYLETFQRLKDDADYRWTGLLCNVLGEFDNPSHEARMNAVQTAARALRGSFRVLYWIEGPRSAELVDAFKTLAPELTVAAPEGGDIDAVLYEHSIKQAKPALVVGHLPDETSSHVLSVVNGTPENVEAYDRMNAYPLEREEWTPTTEGLSQEEIDEGFYTLFHNHDMSNWTVTGRPDGFIEHWGGISWMMPGGERVMSRKRYDNFILRLEWKLYKLEGNSGVFIRAPRANRESAMGMEIQIMGDPGTEPNENSSGAIYDVLPALSNPSNPIGHWNTYEIMADGPLVRVKMNGVVVQDVNLDEHEKLKHRLRNGFIKLQDHGDRVTFRNIRIKELD